MRGIARVNITEAARPLCGALSLSVEGKLKVQASCVIYINYTDKLITFPTPFTIIQLPSDQ